MSEKTRPVALSVLIVSYETRALTLKCLESLFEQTRETAMEVLVWDNASKDGSPEEIARRFPMVELVASDENIGFGMANNHLAKRASGGLLLCLNPDTVVLNHAVDNLVSFARDRPAALLWGGRTLFPDGRLNPTSCWAAPGLWSGLSEACGLHRILPSVLLFNPEGIGGWRRDTIREVDIVSGAFLMIDVELWHKLEGFHPAFWMYGEDADLCLRARHAGAHPVVTPEATIVHYGGASEPGQVGKMVRLFRAKAQLYRLHWSPLRSYLGLILLDFYAYNRFVGLAVLRILSPRRYRASSESWREIWRLRHEWHQAYDGVDPH